MAAGTNAAKPSGVRYFVLLVLVSCGAPAHREGERRFRGTAACAVDEVVLADPQPIEGTYHPPTYYCGRCDAQGDLIVWDERTGHRMCKRGCDGDDDCSSRCVGAAGARHCDEAGRSVTRHPVRERPPQKVEAYRPEHPEPPCEPGEHAAWRDGWDCVRECTHNADCPSGSTCVRSSLVGICSPG